MRRTIGALLLVVAALAAGVGAVWALVKARGAEVDYCGGAGCTSGWYGAAVFLLLGVVAAAVGARLLRRRPSRGRDPT